MENPDVNKDHDDGAVKQRELLNILKNYTIPAVYKVWLEVQSANQQEIENEPIVIASDMRVVTPVYSDQEAH